MRRVKYYERQFPNETRTDVFYDGERVLVGEATFHDWSLYAGHAAAIIELDDGNCKYVTADMIQEMDTHNWVEHRRTEFNSYQAGGIGDP